ncbi:MAG: hypothetical protein A07HR60_00826 [uncultured archaeon A07HR60]|nr:MAG: hypothetical protein A07HR60_00826 [uncultured archaeon A07HR60]
MAPSEAFAPSSRSVSRVRASSYLPCLACSLSLSRHIRSVLTADDTDQSPMVSATRCFTTSSGQTSPTELAIGLMHQYRLVSMRVTAAGVPSI